MIHGIGIALGIGIAGDIDRIGARPDRRQRGIEFRHRFRRDVGECTAEIGETINREHADTAAIGQNRKTAAGKCGYVAQRLGRGEQLVEIENADEAGAAEGRVIDRV